MSSTWSADFFNYAIDSEIFALFDWSSALLVYFTFIIRFYSYKFWILSCFYYNYFFSYYTFCAKAYFTLATYLSRTSWASCCSRVFSVINVFIYLNYFFICFIYSLSAKLDPLLAFDLDYTISLRVEKVFWVDSLKLLKSCEVAFWDFYRSAIFRW